MTDENNNAPSAQGDTAPAEELAPLKAPLWRRILASVVAVVAIIVILLSVVVAWEKAVLQNEDQFVATLRDLPSDDAVATALSIRISERLVERTGVGDFVVDVLPGPLEFLATPLVATISNSVNEITYDVLTSDGFTTVWTTMLRATHRSATVILSGNDKAIVSEDGTVSIDLNEIADVVVARVESRGITLPDLDIDLGEIVLYESDQLAAAQTTASVLDTIGWVVPLLALLLIAGALWAASDRRRMTSFLGFGTAIGLLILLGSLRTGRSIIFGGVENEISQRAGLVVWDTLVELLVQSMWALLVVSLIVGLSAWAFGPSPRARRIVDWVKSTIGRWGDPAGGDETAVGRFVCTWKRPFEIGTVVIAALFILVGPAPTAGSVLVTAIVALVIIGVIEIVAGPSHDTEEETVESEVS